MKYILLSLALLFPTLVYAENSNEKSKIYAAISIQSADGVTQGDMNQEFLKILENHITQRVKFHAEQYLKSIGSKTKTIKIEASSVYLFLENKKLAVTRINAANASQVHIFGIKGDEAIRVACAHDLAAPIPLSYGNCADKIYEAYGVKVGP